MLINIQVVFTIIIARIVMIEFVQSNIIPETRLNNEKSIEMITKFKIEPWTPNSYSFIFETSTGNKREESGFLKKSKNGENVWSVKGFYSYVGPDNRNYQVYYSADENGYQTSRFEPTLENLEIEENTTMSPINLGVANRILPPGLIASLTG